MHNSCNSCGNRRSCGCNCCGILEQISELLFGWNRNDSCSYNTWNNGCGCSSTWNNGCGYGSTWNNGCGCHSCSSNTYSFPVSGRVYVNSSSACNGNGVSVVLNSRNNRSSNGCGCAFVNANNFGSNGYSSCGYSYNN